MTDDDLVAAELARLDAIADSPEADNNALYAFVRAYALRRMPVDMAASILRQEALAALAGQLNWVSNHWAMATVHVRIVARWAGLPMHAVDAALPDRDQAAALAYSRPHKIPLPWGATG